MLLSLNRVLLISGLFGVVCGAVGDQHAQQEFRVTIPARSSLTSVPHTAYQTIDSPPGPSNQVVQDWVMSTTSVEGGSLQISTDRQIWSDEFLLVQHSADVRLDCHVEHADGTWMIAPTSQLMRQAPDSGVTVYTEAPASAHIILKVNVSPKDMPLQTGGWINVFATISQN